MVSISFITNNKKIIKSEEKPVKLINNSVE